MDEIIRRLFLMRHFLPLDVPYRCHMGASHPDEQIDFL
jgi:hypothetical protein